uniref:Uncharacterized protein n=1 Tax=Arundo donax TaxID=35708 RepID=A0A0A8Z1G7_ARUDO
MLCAFYLSGFCQSYSLCSLGHILPISCAVLL